ncbi:hypothetical protein HQQ80_21130 [Microbacteriaceae bacterium VKM Ac-2855]|nr:hypothetical protein [Microbacteriaceae bacterium VKM Ac-2855]
MASTEPLRDAVDMLERAGIEQRPDGPRHLLIHMNGAAVRTVVLPRSRTPTPADVQRDREDAERAGDDAILYVVDRASDSLLRTARENVDVGVIWREAGLLTVGSVEHTVGRRLVDQSQSKRGRAPWGRFAVARLLLRPTEPQTQSALARSAGISQVGVSKALASLGALVVRTDRGWAAVDAGDLFDKVLAEYPGSGGLSTFWYSLDDPTSNGLMALDTVAHIVGSGEEAAMLLSGDLAADEYAPWRRPTSALLYAKAGFGVWIPGFASSAPDRANVEIRTPRDPTVWRTAEAWRDHPAVPMSKPVVDPIIAAHDVNATARSDSGEAVGAIRDRLVAAWETAR